MYGFATEDVNEATAALLVYAVWRSRDYARYRVTPDVWGQIERFAKASAKRAAAIGEFLERLKPRLLCETIRPAAMRTGVLDTWRPADGREFLAEVIAGCDQRAVLSLLYGQTSWIILLVRDRLEREKPMEHQIVAAVAADEGEDE